MAKNSLKWLALVGGLALSAATASFAQDGGLLEVLLRKGIVSDQEAEDIRAEMAKEFRVQAPTPSTSSIRIAADVRVRYQYDNEVANNFNAAPSTGKNNDRSRYRYRFRLGVTGVLSDGWTAGVRLETANGATSTNADFGAVGSTNFAKDGDTAYTGQIYLQYAADNFLFADRADFRIGKHAHPFFTPGVNGFWIDSDINFEGFSEDFTFNTGSLVTNFRAGQYLLAANSRTTAKNGSFLNKPSMMWVFQTELSKPKVWRVAPSFVAFTAPEVTGSTYTSEATNYDDLAALIVPAEYSFKLGGRPAAVYATYGINFKGGDRANRLYSSSGTSITTTTAAGNPSTYNQFGNAGLRFGQSKNKRDLQLVAEYRYIEPGAFASILFDSDFNAGRTNGAGFIVSGSYNLTDAVVFTSTFFHSENIDKNSSGSVGYHKADVLQVDLSAKF